MPGMSVDPASLDILLYPAEVLCHAAGPVGEIDDHVRAVANRMLDLMHEAEGVGLAAPQVGLPWRMFVTRDLDDREAPGGRVFINPGIEVTDEELVETSEGCLSLPGIDVMVRRPRAIRLHATDIDGAQVVLDRDDHFARVFQHELDHLEGVLIIHRMTTMERLKNRRAIRDLERA